MSVEIVCLGEGGGALGQSCYFCEAFNHVRIITLCAFFYTRKTDYINMDIFICKLLTGCAIS